MEASICSQEKTVGLYFVRPAEGASSPALLSAYQACEEGFKAKWVSTEECLHMTPSKQDVFVCDPFDGKAFTYLTTGFKCAVVGPRCILSCLHRTEPIPQLPYPIHNTAMRGLVITTTGFEKARKEELKTFVERMAGIYSADYNLAVTHLVANEVGSKKYQVAVKQEIPIMTGEWVKAVWQAVVKEHTQYTLATDERFLSQACPVLYGLVICVSQLDRTTKDALKGIIVENGGIYSGALEMSKTSVLIISAPEGDKYTHACQWRIRCLTPDWIYDSLQRGHALEMDAYEVKKHKSSTPAHSVLTNVLPPDVSQCSAIMNESILHRTSCVDETVEAGDTATKGKKKPFPKEVNIGLEAIEALDVQEAQKAGLFLDGCKIFLSGFNGTHLEKLRRVLNAGGATRFNQLSEAVSHVVLGKPQEEHMSLVREWSTRPHVVYAHWIIKSIKLRRPAEETLFAYPLEEEVEPVSQHPASPTHTLPQANSCNNNAVSNNNSNNSYIEDEVLKQYMKPGQASTTPTRATTMATTVTASSGNMHVSSTSQDSRTAMVFSSKVFTLSGYSQGTKEEITRVVETHGGQMVPFTYQGCVDYSVVAPEGQWHPQAKEVVSHYFIEDCTDSQRLLPVEYYHIPLLLPEDSCPLEDCCITFSTYAKKEKLFLENLATKLGAQCQDLFAKNANPDKKVLPSTHLVCPLPQGNKYQAAKKWRVPTVTCDWLIECAMRSERIPEGKFLVGCVDHPKLSRKDIFRCLLAPSRYLTSGVATSPEKELAPLITPYPGSTQHPSHPLPVRKKLNLLTDSQINPSSPIHSTKETSSKEFYKKFYEDINKTMKKYKRKHPLQLMEPGALREGRKEDNKEGREEVEEIGEQEQESLEREASASLEGVVVCSSRMLLDMRQEISRVVKQLGGQYLSSYGPEVTHFLFQGRPNDLNREFRRAKYDGKMIVSPDWLWMCHNEGMRVDEALFPHTHNPNMSLSLVSNKSSQGVRQTQGKRKCHEKNEEEDGLQQEETETDSREGKRRQKCESQSEKESLTKQLEEIGALASISGRRNSWGRERNKPPGEWQRHTPSRQHVDLETQTISGEEPESQATAITWEDPVELEARLHLKNQLTKETQHFNAQDQQMDAEDEEGEDTKKENLEDEPLPAKHSTVNNVLKPPSVAKPIFVLVGMSDERRFHYSQMVEELGGTISCSQNLNPEITHLVAQTLSRSERTLGAIASGKWVLHDSYIDHSHQAGHFLEETVYAWGNPAAQHLPVLQPESTHAQLARAAWRWKCAITGSAGSHGQHPFQNMVAVIHTNKERTGAFSRLIEAGGGKVATAKPPYTELENITHFFAEMDKTPEKVELGDFVKRGIPCLQPIFINNCLIMDQMPREEEHYIPQYKDLLASRSGNIPSAIKQMQRK